MRIVLCGSTRFEPLFHEWNFKLACAGHTVYSLSAFGRQAADVGKDDKILLTDEQKITLDLVHLDKILNSDAIAVINEEGYVGFSTSREIQWAKMQGKRIYWLAYNDEAEQLMLADLLPNEPLLAVAPRNPDDDIPF